MDITHLFWYCCWCRKVIYESCGHNVRILWRGGRKICSCVCARGIRRVCASRLFSPNGGNHSVERTYRTQYSSNFAHLPKKVKHNVFKASVQWRSHACQQSHKLRSEFKKANKCLSPEYTSAQKSKVVKPQRFYWVITSKWKLLKAEAVKVKRALLLFEVENII